MTNSVRIKEKKRILNRPRYVYMYLYTIHQRLHAYESLYYTYICNKYICVCVCVCVQRLISMRLTWPALIVGRRRAGKLLSGVLNFLHGSINSRAVCVCVRFCFPIAFLPIRLLSSPHSDHCHTYKISCKFLRLKFRPINRHIIGIRNTYCNVIIPIRIVTTGMHIAVLLSKIICGRAVGARGDA